MNTPVALGVVDAIEWLVWKDHEAHFEATMDHLVTRGLIAEAVARLEAHVAETGPARSQYFDQLCSTIEANHWRREVADLCTLRGRDQITVVLRLRTPPPLVGCHDHLCRCAAEGISRLDGAQF